MMMNSQRIGVIFVPVLILTILSLGRQMKNEEIIPDWNLQLVNKGNPVPENLCVNLVKVPGGEKVDRRIYEPLMEMLSAAEEANSGHQPIVVSGYRTEREQKKLYNKKIKEYKKLGCSSEEACREAEYWVALPGHSEHQLGLAVDIEGDTEETYTWLKENGYQYGFVFRYPGSKTELTGIAEENWHYRYVGVPAATDMYYRDLCLEEYVDVYPEERELQQTSAPD